MLSFTLSSFELPVGASWEVGDDVLGTIVVVVSALLFRTLLDACGAVIGPVVNPWLLGFQGVDIVVYDNLLSLGAVATTHEN